MSHLVGCIRTLNSSGENRMSDDLNLSEAHRYFSAACFNQAWDLIVKPDRTPEESAQMLHLGMASLWHWTQRADRTPTNLSVGYWQVARIYALLGQPSNARDYARRCLDLSVAEGVEPVYLAYAYEALARAEAVAGNVDEVERYLQEARRLAENVEEE
jgi:hypothetical protein